MSPFEWNVAESQESEWLYGSFIKKIQKLPLEVQVGQHLVQMSSLLEQLRGAFLSADQRRDLGLCLRDCYLGLQSLSGVVKDRSLREDLTHFLVVVGSIGVVPEVEKGAPARTLLEAVARGDEVPWTHHLYSALHQVTERGPQGQGARYVVQDPHILDEISVARDALMHDFPAE